MLIWKYYCNSGSAGIESGSDGAVPGFSGAESRDLYRGTAMQDNFLQLPCQ